MYYAMTMVKLLKLVLVLVSLHDHVIVSFKVGSVAPYQARWTSMNLGEEKETNMRKVAPLEYGLVKMQMGFV